MSSIEFKGKQFVYSHHLSVPFRELVVTEHLANSVEVGELLVGDHAEHMSFAMLLESNWQQELEREFPN